MALLDGECGPAQFTDSRIASGDVKALIARTRLEADDGLTALWPKSSGGGVAVRMRGGREFSRTHQYPPGHPNHPLTDAEIERKFMTLSDGVLTASRAARVIEAVANFERYGNVGEVLGHMIAG